MSKGKIRIAIAGVGNCASALIQGLVFYGLESDETNTLGLMSPRIGAYRPGHIEVVAAFDVDERKVGKDVAEAILAAPNNTIQFATVPVSGVLVQRGPTLDGLGPHLRMAITESNAEPVDVAKALKAARADILVSYLPVGSQQASEYYAEMALDAGCAYVNCIPAFLASDPEWRRRFEERRLPIIGDDVKSQVGATIVHRVMTRLFEDRGVQLDRTYQLNFGGNSDFYNMLDTDRLVSKKKSKTQSVNSQLGLPLSADKIHIGPSDFVSWLTDRKIAHIRMEGSGFGGAPVAVELKLEVWDSPNAAGVVIDAVRCAKLALDRGIGGALYGPASYLMKSPPEQFTDDEARKKMWEFINATGAP